MRWALFRLIAAFGEPRAWLPYVVLALFVLAIAVVIALASVHNQLPP